MKAVTALSELARPFVFGMIHVPALPGTPRNRNSMQDILQIVRREATIYADSGIDGIIVENMHDIPYLKKPIGPEIVSGMSLACQEVNNVLGSRRKKFVLGLQILAGCNEEALAVAHNTGFDLIRAECFVFSHVADEGWMDGCAGSLLRYRRTLGADNVSIITDIKKKHSSHSVTSDLSIGEVAQAAEFFLADGVIVTGNSTGKQADPKDLLEVKKSCRLPVFIGSGVSTFNLDMFQEADGLIVGSEFKKEGKWMNELEPQRIIKFMEHVSQISNKR
ncbi:unnamed protein product [Auanema sp. JU1783]|nr:unnamed protein product [Auanema sp. JU1783]